MRTIGRIAALAVLAALASPMAASASQVIGQTSPSDSSCFTGATYRQIGVSAGAGYGTATGGVITSWSTYGGPVGGQPLQLVTMHSNPAGGAGSFIFGGAGGGRGIAAGALNTFAGIRIPIVAGGELGVHVPINSQASCVFDAPSASDAYALGPGDANVDGMSTFVGSNPMARVNASAVVELDADRDGFGDETQDGCPSNGSSQLPCSSAKKSKKCKKHKHRSIVSAKKHRRCHKKRGK